MLNNIIEVDKVHEEEKLCLVISWSRNTQAVARGRLEAGKKDPIISAFDVMFEIYTGKSVCSLYGSRIFY